MPCLGIEKAKSKLKDPGLVYPYHGQSRKSNAAVLAQIAVVVSTYETLASDATYHAQKAGLITVLRVSKFVGGESYVTSLIRFVSHRLRSPWPS